MGDRRNIYQKCGVAERDGTKRALLGEGELARARSRLLGISGAGRGKYEEEEMRESLIETRSEI